MSDQSGIPETAAFETSPSARHSDSLSRRFGRRSVWIVFASTLFVRVIYFVLIDQPPVQFDASRYVAAGLAMPLALTNPALMADSSARENIDFQLLYRDLIKDEQADWLILYPPTFITSLNDVFFAGPVYPAFLGTVFRLTPRYDFWVVRFLQALIDSLTAVLIWLLARRLVSPAAAWWAAGLWALYGPAIYKCGELNTETIAIAIGLLALLAFVRAYDTQQRALLVAAGMLCAILALTKASTSALLPAMLAGWLWARRKNLRSAIVESAIVAMSAAVVMAPWLMVVWLRYGTLALRDPEYAGANLRASNILQSEGYDLHIVPSDFWTYPVWREITRRPLAYAQLYLQKFYRMWGHASDEYRRGFPFGVDGVLKAHQVVVILALFGLLLWPVRAGPVALLPLAFVGYFVALHMVMHVVSRYNLLAMPVAGAAAVLGAQWLLNGSRGRRLWRITGVALIILSMFAGVRLLRPPFWLSLYDLFSWRAAVWAFWISGVIVIAAGVYLLHRTAARSILSRPWVPVGVFTVLALVFLTQAMPREGHADWSVRLDRPGKTARRTVSFPGWVIRDSVEAGFLCIDMVVDEHKTCEVTLSINRYVQNRTADDLVDRNYFYRKPSYPNFMEAYHHRLCDVRQWVVFPLDSTLIDTILNRHELTIDLTARMAGATPGGLTLYGDLPVDDYRHWIGPSFTLGSVERYYEGGDPRIWAQEPLDFRAAQSEIVTDGTSRTDDLSDRWGRQIGQYRMIVTLVKPDGSETNF